tara:strand:+ start:370 stop:576 length:207 start_codon:yes stop_codon:yes gene_type:complete
MKTMQDLRERLRHSLAQKMTDTVRRVSGGQARDFAEYKSVTGRIQGLNDALSLIDDEFKKLLDEGDDA